MSELTAVSRRGGPGRGPVPRLLDALVLESKLAPPLLGFPRCLVRGCWPISPVAWPPPR